MTGQRAASGYRHPGYAQSVRAFGTPRLSPDCGGWVLERPITVTGLRDAMGLYPLFSCLRWRELPHYLTDLDAGMAAISRHHPYCARRAAKALEIEIASDPLEYVDEWCSMYDRLVARHDISGLRAYSRERFLRLLGMPDVLMFRA